MILLKNLCQINIHLYSPDRLYNIQIFYIFLNKLNHNEYKQYFIIIKLTISGRNGRVIILVE